MAPISSPEKPIASRSISPACCNPASASRSSAWSQVAFSAMRLSARRSASFCAEPRCFSTITGALAMPSASAASSRPWPAISTPSSSTSSGLVKPKASMLALICSSCSAECTRALPACGRRSAAGRSRIFAAIQGSGMGTIRIMGVAANCEPNLRADASDLSRAGPPHTILPGRNHEFGNEVAQEPLWLVRHRRYSFSTYPHHTIIDSRAARG